MTVTVPQSTAGQLAMYIDTSDISMLLGPKGWTCSAAYGADGSGGIGLYPPGETPPPPFSEAPFSGEAITIEESGGSPVQAAAQACPFFASAAAATERFLDHGCSAPPAVEQVTQISPGVVSFALPPGVNGSGASSSAPYPTFGVMSYSGTSAPGTQVETCVLTESRQRICALSLDYFATVHGVTPGELALP